MNNMAECIYNAVIRISPEADTSLETKEGALNIIESYISKGWLVTEIVNHMKWCEQFNPEVSEDRALKMMKLVSDKVQLRLKG